MSGEQVCSRFVFISTFTFTDVFAVYCQTKHLILNSYGSWYFYELSVRHVII